MRKLLQSAAPALLIGGLLAANLLPLGGTKDARGPKQSDPPSETAQKPTDPPGQTAPTPTDPIPSPTPDPIYPELPGRLFLWLDGSVAVHLLDRRTWQVTALVGNLFDPVWVDKGLLYLNRAAPGQIFLRTSEGEERVHLDLDGLKKAKVTDLSYTEEASGLSAKPGELPTGLRLVALQSGAVPDTPVFVFQVGETASRYGVGKVVDGAVHLWLFPVGTHSGPCRPFRLQDRLGGLFAGGIGRACQGFLVRLQFGLDHVQNLYGGSEVLIDTTGRWSVKRDGEQLLVMDLDRRIGHAYVIPGQPLHWHGQ